METLDPLLQKPLVAAELTEVYERGRRGALISAGIKRNELKIRYWIRTTLVGTVLFFAGIILGGVS